MDPRHIEDIAEFRIAELAAKVIQGIALPEETSELEAWLKGDAERQQWFDSFRKQPDLTDDLQQLLQYDALTALGQVHQRLNLARKSTTGIRRMWWSIGVAASLVVFAAAFLIWSPRSESLVSDLNRVKEDAIPGHHQAVLTLADGRKVFLRSEQEGIVMESDVITYRDGKPLEQILQMPGQKTKQMQYLTLTTPQGGIYSVTLPDGTEVWLNAASTLKYPVAFDHHERMVELTGEAYFEVAPQKQGSRKVPFRVKTFDYEVDVLGTHFNVRAYPEMQTVRTTLLEGSVRLQNTTHTEEKSQVMRLLLSPAEAGIFSKGKFSKEIVDPLESIAWTKGRFIFNETTLQDLLYELSRWYDVGIDPSSILGSPNKRFSGNLPRQAKLSEVLHLISVTSGIRITLEEGRLVLIE